jgi:hypothetical protein
MAGELKPDSRPAPRWPLAAVAVLFYALLVAAGFLWLWLRERTAVIGERFVGAHGILWSLAAGIAAGLALSWLLATLPRYLPVFARLEQRLAALLGPLGQTGMTVIALASAIGEEFFFRLAMQDALGSWWTAAVFGILHGGPAEFALWALLAFLIGLLLGWAMDGGHGLVAVTLVHALVNYLSLRRMNLQ